MAIKMKKFKALFLTDAGISYNDEVGKRPPPNSDNYYTDDVIIDITQVYELRNVRVPYLGKNFIRLELHCSDFISVIADMDELAREIEQAVNSEMMYKMN